MYLLYVLSSRKYCNNAVWRLVSTICLTVFITVSFTCSVSVEASVQAGGRFERLRNEELRVASVAYRLSIASAALCGPSSSPQSGLVLHSIEQYGLGDRDEAARVFNL